MVEMKRQWLGVALAAGLTVLAALVVAPTGASAQGDLPASLEQCYLTVATQKTSPESLQLGRQLCDAAFGLRARPLAFLDPRSKSCAEWWFDPYGRYEDADRYCSLEGKGDGSWKLACQWKADGKATFVRLRENGSRLEREGELLGRDVGPAFQTLAGCVEHKLAPNPS
ncbi:MAG: hypothetical protein ACR2P8_13240 [Myxococcota bacterium]